MNKAVFAVYLFLAVYCAGSMSVLQLQHFALYPRVGQPEFKNYILANNKAAVLPSILPAVLLTVTSLLLLFYRPSFMSRGIALVCLVLNLINIVSSVIWQGRLHAQLATTGYQATLINQLLRTNWVRTIVLFIQGLVAVYCATSAIR